MSNTTVSKSLRQKIKAKAIVKRLNEVALGELKVSNQSLRAMEIALKKTVPDQAAVTLQDVEGNAIVPIVNINI